MDLWEIMVPHAFNDGTEVPLDAEALCIHGDGPNCIEVGTAIQKRLKELGCKIAPAMIDDMPLIPRKSQPIWGGGLKRLLR